MTVAEALDIAAAHHRTGRLAEAEAIYRRILAEYPDVPEALNLYGVWLYQHGRHEEAVTLLRRAVAVQPDAAECHLHLSIVLNALGLGEEAIATGRRAIALAPHLPEAHYNLGLWLAARGRVEEALEPTREALRLRPLYPEAHTGLGSLLAALERVDEAIASYEEAIRQRPDYAIAHYNLANMLVKRGQEDAAVAGYRTALRIRPDFVDALFNLGNSLHRLEALDAAAEAFERVLTLQPEHTGALWHLGNVWQARGRIDTAIGWWRRAHAIEPDDAALHSTLALYLRFDPGTTPAQVAAEEAAWNLRHAAPLRSRRTIHRPGREPEKRLRIGYVSPDFWDHAVARNVLPLFTEHDRERFELYCYSDTRHPDSLTERLRARADRWRESAGQSHEALAARILADGVDILVDLALHTGGNRLPVFARQPAPVQFSFAGYPGGTGVETIAHRIGDPHLEGDAATTETMHWIDSFWCFDPVELAIPVNPLPAASGAPFTFGCLNQACKVNDAVLALWARVLGSVPGSRLLLLSPPGRHRATTIDTLRAHGVSAERVAFAPRAARADYMRLYHGVDAMLDSFPYGGHTTSLEALWMGVPLVTLPGVAPTSRAGLSQLRNLGLPALIARDADDFVRIAVGLAGGLPRLAELRATLRTRMEQSALMDATRFARGIEAAYRSAWRQWCAEADAASV